MLKQLSCILLILFSLLILLILLFMLIDFIMIFIDCIIYVIVFIYFLCWFKSRRHYTFKNDLFHKIKAFDGNLYVLIRSAQPSRHSCELLYVPIRPVYVPHIKKWKALMESYTFWYVPYNPLDILMNCKKFVHVLYTFPL